MLKRYLEFVEGRGKAVTESFGDEPDSDFETEVAYRLRSLGYLIETQVGVSGFKIDLGVRHPDHPERFIVGVECDGRSYHSSKSARDRDRLREEVLRGLGWEIIRVWSTDWFDNADLQTQRLAKEIENLRKRSFRPYEDYIIISPYDSNVTDKTESDAQGTEESSNTITDASEQQSSAISEPTVATAADSSERLRQTTVEESGLIINSKAARALREFRDATIAVEIEKWEGHRSILREAMIETLIAQGIRDSGDWFMKVPQYLRAGTNPIEKQRYLDRICEIVDRHYVAN